MKKPKDNFVYIHHIYDAIQNIKSFITSTHSLGEFTDDLKTQFAVINQLQDIGEASKKISEEFKNLHTEVNWRGPSKLRDVLVHDYSDVDLDAVWKVINNQLLTLEAEIKKNFSTPNPNDHSPYLRKIL